MHLSRAKSRSLRGSVALVVAALLVGPAARGEDRPAVRATAKARFDTGLRLYEARQFAAAAAEFEATYAIDPQRDVLYVWAQALRLGGQCGRAVPLYQQFLDATPPKAEAERARANLARCRADLVAAPAPSPAPAPPPSGTGPTASDTPPVGDGSAQPVGPLPGLSAPTPTPEAMLTRTPAPRRRLDVVDGVLLGGGGLALAASGGLYLSARSERNQAQNAMTYSEVDQHASAAHTRDRLAWGALSIGVAVLAAALIRLAWR